ncbi:Uncharacterized protein HZ326_23045 [Fusarium oxysporum f. sp. albedinis]|nr:Uncharacterized protein HZ326_23045 [Fusarium oxysporum f. sp. albedinis]
MRSIPITWGSLWRWGFWVSVWNVKACSALELSTDIAKGHCQPSTTEICKATMKMIKDMKLVSQQNQANAMPTYANVLARGGLAARMHNPQNQKASPVQTLREIRDPNNST